MFQVSNTANITTSCPEVRILQVKQMMHIIESNTIYIKETVITTQMLHLNTTIHPKTREQNKPTLRHVSKT